MEFSFYVPTRLPFGAGTVHRTAKIVADLGRRALLVTTRYAMDKLGHAQRLLSDLAGESIGVERFCRSIYMTMDLSPEGVLIPEAIDAVRMISFGSCQLNESQIRTDEALGIRQLRDGFLHPPAGGLSSGCSG